VPVRLLFDNKEPCFKIEISFAYGALSTRGDYESKTGVRFSRTIGQGSGQIAFGYLS